MIFLRQATPGVSDLEDTVCEVFILFPASDKLSILDHHLSLLTHPVSFPYLDAHQTLESTHILLNPIYSIPDLLAPFQILSRGLSKGKMDEEGEREREHLCSIPNYGPW